MGELFLVYVNDLGVTTEGKNSYDLLFAKDPTITFGEKWATVPIGICAKNSKLPDPSTYDVRISFETDIDLILGQNNQCISYLDIQDNIMACAWENITGYEEYPDNRIVLQYGDSFDIVKQKLEQREIKIEYNEQESK